MQAMPLPLGYFLLMNTKYFKMLLGDKIQFFNLLGLQLQKYSIFNVINGKSLAENDDELVRKAIFRPSLYKRLC